MYFALLDISRQLACMKLGSREIYQPIQYCWVHTCRLLGYIVHTCIQQVSCSTPDRTAFALAALMLPCLGYCNLYLQRSCCPVWGSATYTCSARAALSGVLQLIYTCSARAALSGVLQLILAALVLPCLGFCNVYILAALMLPCLGFCNLYLQRSCCPVWGSATYIYLQRSCCPVWGSATYTCSAHAALSGVLQHVHTKLYL